MSNYIHIENLSFSYPGASYQIFSNLNLSIYDGTTVFTGANGSGKTTLATLIAGQAEPSSGRVRCSGSVVIQDQVFTAVSTEDLINIYDGSKENGELMSKLEITDDMIMNPDHLSGGEKKRLQLLACLSSHPEIIILDEPTNHLDQKNKEIMISALKSLDIIKIIITHDRDSADRLSNRTIIFEKEGDSPSVLYDIPLPLSLSLDELKRRKNSLFREYSKVQNDINDLKGKSQKLSEKSSSMEKKLSKANIDKKDHSAKAKIDGARLTSKDRSINDQKRRIESLESHKQKELEGKVRPRMKKEGLSMKASSGYLKEIFFPSKVIEKGDFILSIPDVIISEGDKVGITGDNGAGKTVFINALRERIQELGKENLLLYVAQEYSKDDEGRILAEFDSLNDQEKAEILSDMYRLSSDPSFLLERNISPSPGELKKLDFAISKQKGRRIIIMDEITNHLDIKAITIMEDMLKNSDCTLILVSHDKAFLDSIANRRFEMIRKGRTSYLHVLN